MITPSFWILQHTLVDISIFTCLKQYFSAQDYDFLIPESISYPTVVGIIQANDKDSGSGGDLRYSLSGQGASMFVINPQTGSISVAPGVTLDRERIVKYDLLVTATDNVNQTGPTQVMNIQPPVLVPLCLTPVTVTC